MLFADAKMTEDIKVSNVTKIYCDIADIKTIKEFSEKIVRGFTTNPSLMRKAGAKNYKSYSKQILGFVKINQYRLRFLQMIIKIF